MFDLIWQHCKGLAWFLGWILALVQTIRIWLGTKTERLMLEKSAGGQVIRMVAAYRQVGSPTISYSFTESELREILRSAGMDDQRVFAIMETLEEKGFAKREPSSSEPRWAVK